MGALAAKGRLEKMWAQCYRRRGTADGGYGKKPVYMVPSLPQSLLVKTALRNARPLRPVEKSRAEKTYLQWKRTMLRNI